jgi:hypothetical protein
MTPSAQLSLTLNEVQWDLMLKAIRTAIVSQEDLLKLTAKHRGDMSDQEYVDMHREVSNRKLAFEQIHDLLRATLSEHSRGRPSDFHVA